MEESQKQNFHFLHKMQTEHFYLECAPFNPLRLYREEVKEATKKCGRTHTQLENKRHNQNESSTNYLSSLYHISVKVHSMRRYDQSEIMCVCTEIYSKSLIYVCMLGFPEKST